MPSNCCVWWPWGGKTELVSRQCALVLEGFSADNQAFQREAVQEA